MAVKYDIGSGPNVGLSFSGELGADVGVTVMETRWQILEDVGFAEYPTCIGAAHTAAAWVPIIETWHRVRAVVDFAYDVGRAAEFYGSTGTIRPGDTMTVWASISSADTYKGTMIIESRDIVKEPHGIVRGTMTLRGNGIMKVNTDGA